MKIASFFARMLRFFLRISNDLLVLAGVLVIIWANFQVNRLFGWYSVGIVLVLAGLGLTRLLRRKDQK